jgi:hypothetical protein
MATTNKRFTEGTQLTAAAVTQYTAPANTTSIIKKMTVCNTSGNARLVTIYLVPSAGAAGAANTIWSAKSVAAGATVEVFEAENHVLAAGDFVQALSDVTLTCTFAMSGIEVV